MWLLKIKLCLVRRVSGFHLPVDVNRKQGHVLLRPTERGTSPGLFHPSIKTKSRARHSCLLLNKRLVFCSAVKGVHWSARIVDSVNVHCVGYIKIIIPVCQAENSTYLNGFLWVVRHYDMTSMAYLRRFQPLYNLRNKRFLWLFRNVKPYFCF